MDQAKQYTINEIFYSLQGEGVRVGTANVFVRFSGCNLRCDLKEGPLSPGGFACDTEFVSGVKKTLEEILEEVRAATKGADCSTLILTGGEPGLQVDQEFCDFFHAHEFKLAIETNGTVELPHVSVGDGVSQGKIINERKMYLFDWITVSPKVAEHAVKQLWANEVKYVRGYGQGIPKTSVDSKYKLISPAFDGDQLDPRALDWCLNLCLTNPEWRLSVQQHKRWKVR